MMFVRVLNTIVVIAVHSIGISNLNLEVKEYILYYTNNIVNNDLKIHNI